MRRNVHLIDTTLRDGAQAPHVAFSYDDKVHIVDMLHRAGITMFEAGVPAMGDDECNEISSLKSSFPDCEFIAWCRADMKDLEAAKNCGCESVHISFPVSKQHMSIRGLSEDIVLESLQKYLYIGFQYFKSVSVGAQDASRADSEFLKKFVVQAYTSGASRIRIADTVGILSPLSTIKLINTICERVPGSLVEFHGHNDLGMATANTLVALESGADYTSVTVNGIGERAGNAAIEEVVMAVKETTGLELIFDTKSINEICKEVSIITNKPIPQTKPITGELIFCHESGIHCHGQIKSNGAYEPYDPGKTGRDGSVFVTGTHSGKAGLLSILKRHGFQVTYEDMNEFLPYIKACSKVIKGSLNEKETVMVYEMYKINVRRGA